MDAQTLGALAEIVKEAIAEAVEPLQVRIKELEGRPGYDDSALRQEVKSLREGWDDLRQNQPEPYDDTALCARLEKQMEEVRAEIPKEYDDSETRALVDRLKQMSDTVWGKLEALPAPYDDSALADRVKRIEANVGGDIVPNIARQLAEVPAPYDDSELREQFEAIRADLARETEAVLQRVKEAGYDDTTLREQIEGLQKSRTEVDRALHAVSKAQTETADFVAKLCDRPPPADGRDALQLEILPTIDEQKSYVRGTYAKHAGGLWRSFEQTHGMRGWECIVDGISDVVVSPSDEDPRVVGVGIKRASGASNAVVIAVPALVYKGVFVPEAEYLNGDTVTWAGSLWHCNKTATTAKPGDGSPDWTLAVKKGRDGREVVSVPKAAAQPVQIGGQ